jgi:hypothetical protein
MSSENRSTEQFPEPLSEPHFDEEATVLSAKPVVPLSQVKSGRTNRSSFAVTATIVAALCLGAFGATFLYSKQQVSPASQADTALEAGEEPKPATEDSETLAESIDRPDLLEETHATAETVETEAPLNESGEKLEGGNLKKVSETEKPNSGARPKAKLFGVIRERRASRIERRHAESNEKREESRPRRVKQRQGSSNGQSDLFRIRDIFEGAEVPE